MTDDLVLDEQPDDPGADRQLWELAYVSSAAGSPSERELHQILTTARKHNEAVGITGTLLYSNSSFLQLIEGPRCELKALFDRIKVDPRHADIETILDGPLAARRFPGWAMSFRVFVRLPPLRLRGMTGFLEGEPLDLTDVEPDAAVDLLYRFRETV